MSANGPKPDPDPDPDEIVAQQRTMYQAFENGWRAATQAELAQYWTMQNNARFQMERETLRQDKPTR